MTVVMNWHPAPAAATLTHLLIPAAILSLAAPIAAREPPHRTGRYPAIRIGDCTVTSLPARPGAGAPDTSRVTNMLVIETPDHRIVVDPVASVGDTAATASSPEAAGVKTSGIDVVLLTHVDDQVTAGLVADGVASYPDARVVADAWNVERSATRLSAAGSAALALYRSRHRLNTSIPNTDIVPGVRTRIPPGDIDAGLGAQIACGDQTLLVWSGNIATLLAGQDRGATALPIDRRGFLTAAIRPDVVVASTSGGRPGIGRLYKLADGYHWGPLDARSALSPPPRDATRPPPRPTR